ncbi:MAG: hypothetical protein ACD_51C00280G0001 [uncultured bacterium]|nr:MAG: hypothetical protein ACD_51C00280G0001 [uncultured bacterium]OGJ47564.1 MAG: hypothetical protein A2244_00675 [Candidatus Peregrinibacteria bacterium RIFOXYA2_FULL_41_18]
MKCCEFMKTKWGKVVKIAAFVLLLILVYGAGFNKGGYTTSYEESYYGVVGSSYDDYYDYSEGENKVMSESSISYDYYYDEMPSPGESAVDVSQIDFTDAMIIKNGSLTMRVDSTNESVSAISDLAKSLGGYVSYSSTYENYDGSMAGSVEFRVPADKFDDAMTGVKGMADVIDAESVDAQDVTEEYIDLEARLENKKALEAQYLEVLNSATNVTDILSVYSYLESVRSEIDSLEGQMQYYENQSSYSTITVYLSENITITTPAKDWRPVEVFKEAVSGWIVFLQEIVNFVIVVVVYLWIVPVVWVVVKIVRKMRKGRR